VLTRRKLSITQEEKGSHQMLRMLPLEVASLQQEAATEPLFSPRKLDPQQPGADTECRVDEDANLFDDDRSADAVLFVPETVLQPSAMKDADGA
jgi:hypothetical protein